MIYFSYNDYMDYSENGEIEKIKKVEEDKEKYEITNSEKGINPVVKVLEEKDRLNKFLQTKINFYDARDKNSIKYVERGKDEITCKIKNKEIYIFIKIVENIDSNISYKMLEHSINIIKKWDKSKKKENKRYPIVIPIAIYTGKEEWGITSREIKKLRYVEFKENRIRFSYNLIKLIDF